MFRIIHLIPSTILMYHLLMLHVTPFFVASKSLHLWLNEIGFKLVPGDLNQKHGEEGYRHCQAWMIGSSQIISGDCKLSGVDADSWIDGSELLKISRMTIQVVSIYYFAGSSWNLGNKPNFWVNPQVFQLPTFGSGPESNTNLQAHFFDPSSWILQDQ